MMRGRRWIATSAAASGVALSVSLMGGYSQPAQGVGDSVAMSQEQPEVAFHGQLASPPPKPKSSKRVAKTGRGIEAIGRLRIAERRRSERRGQFEYPTKRRLGVRQDDSRPRNRAVADQQCFPLGMAAGAVTDGPCEDLRYGIPTDPVQTRPSVQQITAGIVLSEARRLNFPGSVVQVQPRGRTLVNLATNVYATPRKIDRTITVLTWPVRILATPTYTWSFGDGTSLTTSTPGAPHPNAEVTHKYLERGRVVVSVTLNYDTWYQVPGGDLLNAGIVNIAAPGTPLEVCEARPVLTDPDSDAPPIPTPTNGSSCS
jgi:PKD domain-containing protein